MKQDNDMKSFIDAVKKAVPDEKGICHVEVNGHKSRFHENAREQILHRSGFKGKTFHDGRADRMRKSLWAIHDAGMCKQVQAFANEYEKYKDADDNTKCIVRERLLIKYGLSELLNGKPLRGGRRGIPVAPMLVEVSDLIPKVWLDAEELGDLA